METSPTVVFDIGATKVAVGVVDQHEKIIAMERHKTPRYYKDELFKLIGTRCLDLAHQYAIDTAVIAFNGPTKFVANDCQVGPLYQICDEVFSLQEAFAAHAPELQNFQILSLNDAEAAAYAAARPPVLKNPIPGEKVTYINIGTGVGGDTICDGKSTRGSVDHLAEYGEQILWLEDGQRVTWGNLVSGEAIQKLYGSEDCCAEVLFKDPATDEIWNKVGKDIARGLLPLLSNIGPDRVVFGGSIAQCHRRFAPALNHELAKSLEALPAGSATKQPEIIYVPKKYLSTIALRGAYVALQSRRDELVLVNQKAATRGPALAESAA